MKEILIETLQRIEREYDVKILFACESGSRAWGFPSQDSDYDVRFIYVHKKEAYLTIDPIGVGSKRDVIELPINNMLDVSGWELTKALRLFRKSNPPLLEWLRSGIVYYEAYSTIEKMKTISKEVFAPTSCLYHYLNMASKNFREFLQGDKVKIKKYFYVLRPVLASRWIEQFNEFPPLEFQTLLQTVVPEGELRQEIHTLLQRKMAGEEFDLEPKITVIHDFLEEEITRLNAFAKTCEADVPNFTKRLDNLFRETLDEVWESSH
ncbi:nucleotidyltransferase domain-containing protein [Ectobacillus antri]|uniref:Nucleotidyltransferase domain-containing protein n=1 Tax=Ectobacillus antri TaxID=2486280 RepID=A0ABT6H4W9_9BACI|nr:nucleotidyltransferase domain-containing protein [Ectobacillus antri]MDG4658064.1 nucleotidyltransferase domain-containing protein [Ectobacillus antri]MDG5753695.1 nucleotidyltransferase domain-containing protein [Ectobacillus antri]